MKTAGAQPSPKKRNDQRLGHRTRSEPVLTMVPSERPAIPALPAHYLGVVRKAWTDYLRSPVAQSINPLADLTALTEWAWALNEWHLEVVKELPDRRYMKQLTDILHRAQIEFGMTPLARSRLGVTIGQAKLTAQTLNERIAARPTMPEDWAEGWDEA